MNKHVQTQLWAGPKSHAWPARALAECPECHAPTAGKPFCPRDGSFTAASPFTVGQRYVVEERLGSGGTALVFGARHTMLGRPVALKVLRQERAGDPTESERFLRAARLATQLHHENVVTILDFGWDEALDLHFLVMERVTGRTLAEVIAEAAPLPWDRAARILVQLCRALSAAHAEKIVHRDLNPRNVVLVQSSGRSDVAKLCDFGLSRLADGGDRITATGSMVGTPAYMAPEQVRGDAGQDERVDLYALGVTAYELLTGKLPYRAATPVALIASKLTDEVIPLRATLPEIEIPPAVEEWVARCLSRDPARRPTSAAECEDLLARALSGPKAEPSRQGLVDLIGRNIGSYRVTALIGTGGVGSVYRAEHPLIGTRVAVKVLLPEVASMPGIGERFLQEARASSEIGSPHIARYLDFGYLPDGRPFGVMEHLDGETLSELLFKRERFTLAQTAELTAQVAGAMAAAHAAGIIHRDLKPDNLFVVDGPDGRPMVKVLDFGIAKVRAPAGVASLTQVGFIMGTPLYCSPEQLYGEDVGPATDIYALGTTVFEMISGRTPFLGESAQVIGAKTTGEAPRLDELVPEVPREVADFVARMIARSTAERPASMHDVQEEALRWLRPEPPRAPMVPRRKPKPWLRWSALGALLLLALVLWGVTRRPAAHKTVAPLSVTPPPVPAIPLPAPVVTPLAPTIVPPPRAKPKRPRKRAAGKDVIIADPFQ